MKVRSILVATVVGVLTFEVAAVVIAQDIPERAVPTKAPETTVAAAPVFSPGLSDLMTMLVQPRHLKLYYAGTRKNWELAAFELRELRSALRRIGQAMPHYQGNSVDDSVKGLMAPSLDAVGNAIASGDSKQFAQAFANLTTSCNSCHGYMEHPFLVIRVPDAAMKNSAYAGQEFSSRP